MTISCARIFEINDFTKESMNFRGPIVIGTKVLPPTLDNRLDCE